MTTSAVTPLNLTEYLHTLKRKSLSGPRTFYSIKYKHDELSEQRPMDLLHNQGH